MNPVIFTHVAFRAFNLAKMILDTRGQDLIEYALVAGSVTLAGAATVPQVAQQVAMIVCDLQWYLFLAGGSSDGACFT